ncbi:MAG: cation diffusion facilitator family transporter [Erysipelotrichales bacterium]|nr:cation diffusion facilitator family transporter [Erysipelotrichales bacterium]
MEKSKIASRSARLIIKVSIVNITVNLILTILKMIFGFFYGNLSVISDALHSASDLATSFLIIIIVFISSPKADKKHNYGHEKIESLATLFIACFLASLGAFLIWQGVSGIISPVYAEINFYLIGVTVLSLVFKEGLFWFGIHYAKKLDSEILKADAWHSRSDSLSSVAVLIGLIATHFIGNNIAESIVVLIISLFILKVAFGIFRTAVNQLTDKAVNDDIYNKIKEISSQVIGVKAIDNLRTRMFGSSIYVDIEIAVDGSLTVNESHAIAEHVHDKLESSVDLRIKHCTVHVNPINENN